MLFYVAQLESSFSSIPIGANGSEGYLQQEYEEEYLRSACVQSIIDNQRGCCWGACDSGDSLCDTDGAGWLRRICIMIILVTIVLVVGLFCGCCLIAVIACLLGYDLCTEHDDD